MSPRIAIIIPARYPSTRFPAKPLAMIAGKTLIQRVLELGHAVGMGEVYAATDDERIIKHVEGLGFKAVMTDPALPSGTDRVFAAAATLKQKPDIIVNLQGDMPLAPPRILQAAIAPMLQDPSIPMTTLAFRMTDEQVEHYQSVLSRGQVGGTTVVTDKDGWALYFSKAILPQPRTGGFKVAPLMHMGLYAYRYDTLEKYVSLPVSTLEKAEALEQLRLLENGVRIKVVEVDMQGIVAHEVNWPEDVALVEASIKKHGELV